MDTTISSCAWSLLLPGNSAPEIFSLSHGMVICNRVSDGLMCGNRKMLPSIAEIFELVWVASVMTWRHGNHRNFIMARSGHFTSVPVYLCKVCRAPGP